MSEATNLWSGAAGQASKPLVEKLGLVNGRNIVLSAPEGYIASLKLTTEVTLSSHLEPEADFIQAFYIQTDKLMSDIAKLKQSLKVTGQLWISWPKRTSKLAGDLGESAVRSIGLAHGLVDVKVAAIDADWSGLKFVFRLKDR